MRQFILFFGFGIIIIIALPLFWLKLLQWAFLDNTAIIAEGISLVGAILGGTISGALTLIGVKLTLKSSIDQVDKTLDEQHNIREEELKNNAVKEQLFKLYHPLNAIISGHIFKYGAHEFDTLTFDEQLEFMNFITEYDIYAEKDFYIKIVEIRWAFKDGDINKANGFYREISDLLTDSISVMKAQLKLPNQEL